MWILYSLMSIGILIIFAIQKSTDSEWDGMLYTFGDAEVEYLVTSEAKDSCRIKIGMSAVDCLTFKIKHRSVLDTFFSRIRFSTEHKLGCHTFDSKFYISCDNLQFIKLLKETSVARSYVRKLMSKRNQHRLRPEFIRCHGGKLWVEYVVPNHYEDCSPHELFTKLIPSLSNITKLLADELTLSPRRSKSKPKPKDKFAFKASATNAVSLLLFSIGTVNIFLLTLEYYPITLHDKQLAIDTAKLSAIIVVLLTILIAALFKGSSRRHLILANFLASGSAGIFLITFVTLRDINVHWDKSAIEVHTVKISHKYKNDGLSFISTKEWSDHYNHYSIEVPNKLYRSTWVGSQIKYTLGRGYLGYHWIKSIEKVPH